MLWQSLPCRSKAPVYLVTKSHIGQGNYRAIARQRWVSFRGRDQVAFLGTTGIGPLGCAAWQTDMTWNARRTWEEHCRRRLRARVQYSAVQTWTVSLAVGSDRDSSIRATSHIVSDKCNAVVVSSRVLGPFVHLFICSFVHNRTVPGTAIATTTAVGTPSIPLVSPANPPFTERRAGLPQVDMRASYTTTPQTPTTATTLAQLMLRSRDHLGSQSAADFMFCLSRPLSRLGSILHP